MYRKALNYLRGQAVVRITCETPERVVNLCAAHGVSAQACVHDELPGKVAFGAFKG